MSASRIINLSETEAQEAARLVRASLNAGGIVAFPTETVYGLGVLAGNTDGIERLYALKGREKTKFMAEYVDSAASARAQADQFSLRAEKLARAFWPGPLTLVLPKADGSTQGFRCSSHPVANLMTLDLNSALLGTSANLSGSEPLASGAEIAAAFGDGLDLIVDAGPLPEGQASAVIELPRDGGFRVLRPGALEPHLIAAELEMLVVFVCTGNTCRSPLAQAMLEKALAERPADRQLNRVEVASAGLSADHGSPASMNSQIVGRELGLDLGRHGSRYLDSGLIQRADRIYTMTALHREAILYAHPELEERIRTLGDDGRDIADPYGGDLDEYRACAGEIDHALKKVMNEL